MTIHCFASILTPFGTAANNRGENEGNMTTLQKLLWKGQTHTTVSAESIRFAVRRQLETLDSQGCNRRWEEVTRDNQWADPTFKAWKEGAKQPSFADDDLLGFMSAEGAKEEGGKGSTTARRAVLEVTRAVSLTPWTGDVTFNAASVGATPSAAKKGSNPVPYGAEVHATRYQYSVAMTPSRLREPERAALALTALCGLGPVAGNHARFLYDFSPDAVVFRITEDPAPRVLYCFEADESAVSVPELLRRVAAGDILAQELILGGSVVDQLNEEAKAVLAGASLHPGIKAACQEAIKRLKEA